MSDRPPVDPPPAQWPSDSAEPVTPQPEHRHFWVVTVVIACVVVAVAAVTALLIRSNHDDGAISGSAVHVNTEVYAAAMKSGSFHYVNQNQTSEGGYTADETVTGDVGLHQGDQSISGILGDSEIVLVNSTAYFKGNAAALQSQIGYTESQAAMYAGQWISFRPTDAPYESVVDELTTRTFWGNPFEAPLAALRQAPTSVAGISILGGHKVQSVISSIHETVKSTSSTFFGTSQIYFAIASPHLPYGVTDHQSGTLAGSPDSNRDSATFTKWGEPVTVTAPAGAVPFSSLVPPATPT